MTRAFAVLIAGLALLASAAVWADARQAPLFIADSQASAPVIETAALSGS